MGKPKFYVVWIGRKTGIFDSWPECRSQTEGFPKAKFKAFDSRQLAEAAYQGNSADFIIKKPTDPLAGKTRREFPDGLITESIAVDGAWNTVTGVMEYRGVNTLTNKELFRSERYEDGTNNIAEFLAIVHALNYCKQHNIAWPVYSDSRTAIKWVKDKRPRTSCKETGKNKILFELMDRATEWLKHNQYDNPVYQWDTKAWGENPADFGRK